MVVLNSLQEVIIFVLLTIFYDNTKIMIRNKNMDNQH